MSETQQETGTGESTTSSLSRPKNTTSLTQSIEKPEGSMATGQSNYNARRCRIIRILKEKDLLEAIESSTVSVAKDDQAFMIIIHNIKDSQIPHVQDASTATSAKSHPASDTVVLRPDSGSVDSASCASCAPCTQAPHLVASGTSGHPSPYWVPSGHMQLSNPASHASRLQPQHHRTSGFTTTPEYPPSPMVRKGYFLAQKI